MNTRHYAFWPKGVDYHMPIPATNLYYNAEVSAKRYPDKSFIIYYDYHVTFAQFLREAEAVAGFLTQSCGVKQGDRVIIDMQNSPQFVIAYYGILRAGAVVVPLNPMNRTAELRHYVEDSGARVAFVAQEVFAQMRPLLGAGLDHIIAVTYADYVGAKPTVRVPDFVSAPRAVKPEPGVSLWHTAIEAGLSAPPLRTGPDDLAVMPYTSGTTGLPKGCAHTNRNVMATVTGQRQWTRPSLETRILVILPFFHVTAMQGAMNVPLMNASTIVILPRWEARMAAHYIAHYRINAFSAVPTAIIDLLLLPDIDNYDFSSLRQVGGGGAAMPEAVAQKLQDKCGLGFLEGYGMTETMAPTHLNPPDAMKKQCLGIPMFDVDARIIDPLTLAELPQGEVGEIIVSGPQIMQGYWQRPEANASAFIERDGKRFLRTGDLGRMDEDGYYFMVDRLKRMINASGFKVWPAEVESILYGHPAVAEACIISAPDPHRGETVKALVVLKAGSAENVDDEAIIEWSRNQMASYKAPRIVEFVESLPKSATGKVAWRLLQDQENERSKKP
ncbi:MAG: long-chain fatty acid--CoA ligase [Hyphomicrobiales bacterium]|nr:long-chain fatty acid--CoA ligase [Hyphomicrobiales bacterium]